MSSNFRIIVKYTKKRVEYRPPAFLFGVNAKSASPQENPLRAGKPARALQRQRLAGKPPGLGDGPVDHFALHDVEPQFQFAVFLAGTAPALVGELDDVREAWRW